MSRPETPTLVEAGRRSLWSDVRASFSGRRQDYTKGPVGRAILVLSIPMVLEMLMQAVFEVADVFFVGRLGADAVAAVGLTAAVLILVFAVGIGLSMAATATVARRIGEHDSEGAARAAVQAILVTVVVSVPVAVVGLVFAPDLLALMGGTPEVIAIGTPYFAVLFGTNLVILLLFLINAIFRGTGDAVYAMRTLWLANGLNIVLDPILIFGWGPFPELGVLGAGVATVIGRSVGVTYQVWILVRGTERIQIRRSHVKVDPEILRRLLRISGPGILQYLIGTASWMGIMRLMATFGSAALAGYTIGVRVIIFALLPSWGLGNAAATLVGQNLGANQPDRAEKSVWITGLANTVFLGLFAVGLFLFAEEIIRLFTPEAEVVRFGASCLRIVSFSYIFFGVGAVTVQAFNGAGDTTTPTGINLVSYWIIQIPLAFVLSQTLGWGPNGIFIAISVAQTALAIIGVWMFRKGRWKTKVV